LELLEQMLIVLAVLVVFGGGLWLLRKRGLVHLNVVSRSSKRRNTEVLDRVTLTAHHSIHVVRLADRILVVGVWPNGCNLLDRTDLATLGRYADSQFGFPKEGDPR
jgi:flagellar biogenesis protein FliO